MRTCKTILFFVAFLSFGMRVSAQVANTDSLLNLYNETESDSVKLSVLIEFIRGYNDPEADSSLNLMMEARELAVKLKDSTNVAFVNYRLAIITGYQGDYYQALKYGLDAMRYYEKIGVDEFMAAILNNLGESYLELDLYNEAYDYYNKALNKAKEQRDTLTVAIATHNLGRVLKTTGQLERAREFIMNGKAISEQIGDTVGIPFALNDLGEIYLMEGDYDKALVVLDEALDIIGSMEENLDLTSLFPEILNKMAIIHREKKDFDEALKYHDQAFTYYDRLSNESGMAEVYLGKARTLMQTNNLEEANKLLNLGLGMSIDEKNKGLEVEFFEELSLLFELRGDYKKALEYYKRYKTSGDSLYSEKKSEQFSQLQIKYETQKKDIEIDLLTQQETQRKAELKNEEFLRNVLVVILAFTAVLLITLYRSGARRKRINELLIVHQKEIEARRKELEGLIELKDKFFSIVSHDLRSPINALVGLLDMLGEGHLTQEELINVTRSLRIRLNNTRKLLDNLLDWAMVQMNEIEIKNEELELKLVAEENLTFFREVNEKEINFLNRIKGVKVLTDKNMLDLVIRNLISNSIKFTQQKGKVEVYTEDADHDDELIVCIADDGVGMSPEQVKKVFDNTLIYTTPGTSNEKGTGLGLKLCKEFVDRMGGKIWAESTEGQGSVFKFTVKKA